MFNGPITFDRLARWGIIALAIVMSLVIVDYLSAVLLPFFIAWLLAYLLYPLVKFIQYRMHIRIRALSILLAMLFCIAVLCGVFMFIIPPMIEQFGRFTSLVTRYMHNVTNINNIPEAIRLWLSENNGEIERFLHSDDFAKTIKEAMPRLFSMVGKTMSVLLSIVASCITLLYMFFILLDYENLTQKWIKIFPPSVRPFWQELMGDVEVALNNYIRGQGTVSFIMGVLFCIGFTIIGFPMAIGLGIMIGVMNMVPYLHTFALIPAALLAAMKSADTGESFWGIMAMVLAVFIIVQIISDAIVTPKVMGHRMGLNPAVLLLSLSVWGALLGFIGLIIALPATTIIIAYWKRYVTHDEEEGKPAVNEQSTGA